MADALRERAQRIYDKYGNVMMDVAGLSKAGVDRKATCRALFSKLLYLAGTSLPTLPGGICGLLTSRRGWWVVPAAKSTLTGT